MPIVSDLPAPWALVAAIAVACVAGVVFSVVMIRLYGLRSLAKMAPHDFVVTVALGSVLAATAARSVSLTNGLLGIGGLFAAQGILSRVRKMGGEALVDNDPVLLMIGTEVQWDKMDETGVTAADLRAKLREANALRFDEIRAVVLEGTGDIAVLHGAADGAKLDPSLLEGCTNVPEALPDSWEVGDDDPLERWGDTPQERVG